MQNLLSAIKELGSNELSEAIQAIICRYSQLYPDWETMFLSLPKNNTEERTRIIDAAFEILKKQ